MIPSAFGNCAHLPHKFGGLWRCWVCCGVWLEGPPTDTFVDAADVADAARAARLDLVVQRLNAKVARKATSKRLRMIAEFGDDDEPDAA